MGLFTGVTSFTGATGSNRLLQGLAGSTGSKFQSGANPMFAGQPNVLYRQFSSMGGPPVGGGAIATQGSRIVPVIATATGGAPGLGPFGGRMGAPGGFAVQNPTQVVSDSGITSSYQQGQMNPYRTQLYGRLGPTSSYTLALHPEKYKTLTAGSSGMKGKNWTAGPQSNIVAKGLSLIDARREPGLGTAEGQRYKKTLASEVAGANMVFDPLSGQWGSRNLFRQHLNQAMMGRAMGIGKQPPLSTGYSPNETWKQRLQAGKPREHESTKDTTTPTVEVYEGKSRV